MIDSRVTLQPFEENKDKWIVTWPIVKTTLTNGHQTIRRAAIDEAHTGFAFKVGIRAVCEAQL